MKRCTTDREIKRRLRDEHKAFSMFDDVVVPLIPYHVAAAGYVDGEYPTFRTLVERGKNHPLLSVAVFAASVAMCLDIENGDASIPQAAEWFHRMRRAGIERPCFYISVDNAPPLIQELIHNHEIPRKDYRLWTAHYTYQPHLCSPHSCGALRSTTADATQWTSHSSGESLDRSLVKADFFHTKPTRRVK